MKSLNWIKGVFWTTCLYDGILGIIFILIPLKIFDFFGVTHPNHIGYVQFPALLLITFAYMFYQIAKDPVANRNLIIYAILLKISYCLVVFPHWLSNNIPNIWVPFAFFDLIFLILFILAYKTLPVQTQVNKTA